MAESFMLSKGQTQSASIGCGSLILVGFVVFLATQSIVNPLKEDLSRLRIEVGELKELIETQSKLIGALEKSMSKPPTPDPK